MTTLSAWVAMSYANDKATLLALIACSDVVRGSAVVCAVGASVLSV